MCELPELVSSGEPGRGKRGSLSLMADLDTGSRRNLQMGRRVQGSAIDSANNFLSVARP